LSFLINSALSICFPSRCGDRIRAQLRLVHTAHLSGKTAFKWERFLSMSIDQIARKLPLIVLRYFIMSKVIEISPKTFQGNITYINSDQMFHEMIRDYKRLSRFEINELRDCTKWLTRNIPINPQCVGKVVDTFTLSNLFVLFDLFDLEMKEIFYAFFYWNF